MKSRLSFKQIMTLSLLLMTFCEGRAVSEETNSRSLPTIERELLKTLADLSSDGNSVQQTEKLQEGLDQTFAQWSNRVAPAAHLSVGWSNDDALAERKKRHLAIQVAQARLEEFVVMLKPSREKDKDPMRANFVPRFCELIGKLVHDEISGLPAKDKKAVRDFFSSAKSPTAFARATGLAHLCIAKQQVGNRPAVVKEIDQAVESLVQLSSDRPDVSTNWPSVRMGVMEMAKDYQIRSLNLSREIKVRRVLDQLVQLSPYYRRFLVARQVHRIAKTRTELAQKNTVPQTQLSGLQKRQALAQKLEQHYRLKCGDPYDRKVAQLTKEMEVRQQEVRGLQEANDKYNFATRTFTIEIKKVAAEHLKRAAQLLKASGDTELADRVNGLFGKLTAS